MVIRRGISPEFQFPLPSRGKTTIAVTHPARAAGLVKPPSRLKIAGERIITAKKERILAREKKIAENQVSGAAGFRAAPEKSLQLAKIAARVAAENGGTNLVVIDMTGLTALFDYFVIATGTSTRQLKAMAEDIEARVKSELNDRRMNIDGSDDSRWIVLDYGTVVVHLFDEETRQFYGLEALWADCPRLDLTETLKGV